MNRTIFAFCTSALLSSAAIAAPNFLTTTGTARPNVKVIFDKSYLVTPRVPYQSGFTPVFDAPVATRRIVLRQEGAGCNLVSEGVRYLNNLRVGELVAVQSGRDAVYQIPDGQITAINLMFHHRGALNANCRVVVEAEIDEGGSDDGEWVDWDTAATFDIMAEWGGEPHRVGPFAINDLVKAVRVYIPRACGDVELVDSALEVNGEWQELGADAFLMSRTEDEKTFAYNFRGLTELNQAAFRVRGKRRDCTAEVQVVYY